MSVMPRTPVVARPISRTSRSTKRMAMPSRVASTTSQLPSASCTLISSSPSSMFMAFSPTRRGLP